MIIIEAIDVTLSLIGFVGLIVGEKVLEFIMPHFLIVDEVLKM